MGGKRQPGYAESSTNGIEIRQLKNGRSTLRINFRYRGARCREPLKLEATAQNIKYAVRLRGEILNAIARGNFSYGSYFPHSRRAKIFGHVVNTVTIKQLLNDYLKQAEKTLEFSTYESYEKMANCHLIPVFGDLKICDLKASNIRDWVKSVDIKLKSIKNILIPLRAVLDQAVTDELITANPMNKVILAKLVNKSSKSDFIVDPFDKGEIKAILDNCPTEQERNLYQTAFFSNMRTSELIAFEWKDIDWEKNVIKVRKAFVRRRIKGPKTISGNRDILMFPQVQEALENQKKYTLKDGGRVFFNPKTGKPWTGDNQIRETSWRHIFKKISIRYRNPYQTRHTWASMMLSRGENIMWVARQMGHANIQMVIKTYAKWIPDKSVAGGYVPVNNWGEYLDNLAPQQPHVK